MNVEKSIQETKEKKSIKMLTKIVKYYMSLADYWVTHHINKRNFRRVIGKVDKAFRLRSKWESRE